MMKKVFLVVFAFILTAFIGVQFIQDTTALPTTVDVEFVAVFDTGNETPVLTEAQYGDTFTTTELANDDYTFAFWVVNGVVRPDLPEVTTFVVSRTLNIQGVYYPDDQHAVLFVDSSGKYLGVDYVLDGGNATPPTTLPDKPNYEVNTINPWSDTYSDVDSSRVLVLQYVLDAATTFDVFVTGGTTNHAEPVYNQIVTVIATDLENFTHWEEDGVVVSYEAVYRFSALRDRNLVAATGGTASGVVTLSYDLEIRTGHKSFLGQYELPEDYTFVEAGYLKAAYGTTMEYGQSGVDHVLANAIHPTTKEFLTSFPTAEVDNLRAYVVAKNTADQLVVFYSDYTHALWADLGTIGGNNVDTVWSGKATRDEEKLTFIFSTDVIIPSTPLVTFYVYIHTGDLTIGIANTNMYRFSVANDTARRINHYPNGANVSLTANNSAANTLGLTHENAQFYVENGVSHARMTIPYSIFTNIGVTGIGVDSVLPFSLSVHQGGSGGGDDWWYRTDLPGITGGSGLVVRTNPLDSVVLNEYNQLSTLDPLKFFSEESIEARFALTSGYVEDKSLFGNLATATVNNGVFATLEVGGYVWSDRTEEDPGTTHRFNTNLPSGLHDRQFTYVNLTGNTTGSEITITKAGYVIVVVNHSTAAYNSILDAGWTPLGTSIEPIGPGDRISFFAKWVDVDQTLALGNWSFFVVQPDTAE